MSSFRLTAGSLRSRQLSEECQWGSNFYTQTHTVLVFTLPDGTEMELRDAIHGGQPALSECNTFSPGTGNASRGRLFSSWDRLLTFVSDTNIYDDIFATSSVIERYPSGYLLQKDGTRHRIKDGRVEWLRDRNGNLVTFTYEESAYNRLANIKDALNRQITITYSHWDPELSDISITYKGFGGAPRTISIQRALLQDALIANETTATFQALFPGTLGSSTEQFNARVVKTITLPDNRTYQFRYNRYGELSRAELPTGGMFTYQWASGNTQNPSGWEGKFINRRVIKKSIYKDATTRVGSTSFGLFEADPSGTFGSAKIRQLDEFDAPLADERHYFHGLPMDHVNHEFGYSGPPIIGREFKSERNTANGATLLQRIEHTYDSAGININQILTTLADISPNLVSKQTFAYDEFFNLTDTYEYDFGQGTPGSFLRRSHTEYINTSVYTGTDPLAVHAGTAAHLRNLPSQTWVSSDAAGNTKKALIVYEYDNYADDVLHDPLTPRSNISALCTTFDAAGTCSNDNPTSYLTRGNVTKVTAYANASAQTGAVIIASQYDIAGNVVKTIDARGYPTQFDFDDCFGSPDANAQNCAGAAELGAQGSYALPRSVTNALGHVGRLQYDYYLGKPVDTADVNGVVTSVEYNDALDRTKRVIRAANQGASVRSQTIIDYDDANKTVTSSTDLNNFDDRAIVSKILYDGLGRTTETRQYEGGTNYIVTQVEYDALVASIQDLKPLPPLGRSKHCVDHPGV
jgi:YD repeat-containing protein